MPVHGTATGCRFFFNRGVGIQLGKELLNVGKFKGEHERLVAVVATSKIARFEGLCKCDLSDFFAISENTEFGFPGKHFLAAKKTGFAAFAGNLVIMKNCLFEFFKTEFLFLFGLREGWFAHGK